LICGLIYARPLHGAHCTLLDELCSYEITEFGQYMRMDLSVSKYVQCKKKGHTDNTVSHVLSCQSNNENIGADLQFSVPKFRHQRGSNRLLCVNELRYLSGIEKGFVVTLILQTL